MSGMVCHYDSIVGIIRLLNDRTFKDSRQSEGDCRRDGRYMRRVCPPITPTGGQQTYLETLIFTAALVALRACKLCGKE